MNEQSLSLSGFAAERPGGNEGAHPPAPLAEVVSDGRSETPAAGTLSRARPADGLGAQNLGPDAVVRSWIDRMRAAVDVPMPQHDGKEAA